jgi:putative addiction module component (TIGR02574 family)
MHGMKEIIEEAKSLSMEDRLLVIDSLLQTINPPVPEIDSEWAAVAENRLSEIKSGRVKTLPGDEVFERIGKPFKK